MEPKRIILVDGSHLLSEMLQRVLNRVDDLVVVDLLSDFSALSAAIEEKKPDWVVFSQPTDGSLPEEISAILVEHPHLHVLAITMDTGDIKILWVGRQKKKIKVTTVEDLRNILRRIKNGVRFQSSSG